MPRVRGSRSTCVSTASCLARRSGTPSILRRTRARPTQPSGSWSTHRTSAGAGAAHGQVGPEDLQATAASPRGSLPASSGAGRPVVHPASRGPGSPPATEDNLGGRPATAEGPPRERPRPALVTATKAPRSRRPSPRAAAASAAGRRRPRRARLRRSSRTAAPAGAGAGRAPASDEVRLRQMILHAGGATADKLISASPRRHAVYLRGGASRAAPGVPDDQTWLGLLLTLRGPRPRGRVPELVRPVGVP
mmetsp:Transcript_18507/g.41904  ORF Transcript_18507/g.41904 Transcript_18507/m.41904 type:complete len:249 (+) Transcript_18507:139-885(+)